MSWWRIALAVACATAATADAAAATGNPTHATVVAPPVGAVFDYQIGGAYPPAASVAIVDRDRSDPPVAGRYNICYVNAFQTQVIEDEFWKRRHPGLLLHGASGRLLEDPGYPGEVLLDTSTPARRLAIAAIVGGWFDGCAAHGYQAVEPDNLDSWARSRGRLTMADNVALARLLVGRAHRDGLAIAQKNTTELGDEGRRSIGFDFAIAEECQLYDECPAFTGPYGRHVIEIEYTDHPRRFFVAACAARGRLISIVLRDRGVVPRGSTGYHDEHC